MNAKRLKILYLKAVQKYFSRFAKPDLFNRILRYEGFEIGEGTIFYSPQTIVIDRQRPWMLKIGKYCKITLGCTILPMIIVALYYVELMERLLVRQG